MPSPPGLCALQCHTHVLTAAVCTVCMLAGKATILEEGIDWEELMWGPSYFRVRGAEYPVERLLYVPYTVAA